MLERGQVAQAWREPWDSLTLLSPNWFARLPNYKYQRGDPDGFLGRDDIVQFFANYASVLKAPIESRFDDARVHSPDGSNRFIVRGADGRSFDADNVVVAIGGYHRPYIPPVGALLPRDVVQVHSQSYRTPGQLPPGAILVVGAAASGHQIGEELVRSGRTVYMSVGSHNKLPRRYRGRDTIWWMEQLGSFETTVGMLPSIEDAMRRPSVSLTGVDGGHDLDLRSLEQEGATLLGHIAGADGSQVRVAADLEASLADGDKVYTGFVESVDRYVEHTGLRCDPPDDRRHRGEAHVRKHVSTLDLAEAGIRAILWATGFTRDFDWIESSSIAPGRDPRHVRGVSTQPGLFFLGLRWLHTRRSNFIDGAGRDAAFVRDQILRRAGRG